MTEASWQTEPTGTQMAGHVWYRCAECQELIEAEATIFLGAGKEARAYHIDHVPSTQALGDELDKETSNGR